MHTSIPHIFLRKRKSVVHIFLMNVLSVQVHTYVNTTGLQEERRCRSSGHAPLELRTSNPESAHPAPPNEIEPHVVLESEGAKFVLGPTPVQRQMLLKERQHEQSYKSLNLLFI